MTEARDRLVVIGLNAMIEYAKDHGLLVRDEDEARMRREWAVLLVGVAEMILNRVKP